MDTSKFPCLGAIIGDTVGSVYEFDNIKTTDFLGNNGENI